MTSLRKDLIAVLDAHLGKNLGEVDDRMNELRESIRELTEENKALREQNAQLTSYQDRLRHQINIARKATIALTEMVDE